MEKETLLRGHKKKEIIVKKGKERTLKERRYLID